MFSEIILDEFTQECIDSNPGGMAARYLVKSLYILSPRQENRRAHDFYRRRHQVTADKRERGGVDSRHSVKFVHRAQTLTARG